MSRFFIDRPVFAWVIAIIIVIAGGLSIVQLPVEQYPDLAPPSVSVNASYPGASAETVEESVTQVIEQAMKGIDNLEYMSGSSSQNGGGVSLTFYSGAQYQETSRIGAGDLQPGDLVFLGPGGANHVEIYIGGGMVVSASNAATGVRLVALGYNGNASGYGRVHG